MNIVVWCCLKVVITIVCLHVNCHRAGTLHFSKQTQTHVNRLYNHNHRVLRVLWEAMST